MVNGVSLTPLGTQLSRNCDLMSSWNNNRLTQGNRVFIRIRELCREYTRRSRKKEPLVGIEGDSGSGTLALLGFRLEAEQDKPEVVRIGIESPDPERHAFAKSMHMAYLQRKLVPSRHASLRSDTTRAVTANCKEGDVLVSNEIWRSNAPKIDNVLPLAETTLPIPSVARSYKAEDAASELKRVQFISATAAPVSKSEVHFTDELPESQRIELRTNTPGPARLVQEIKTVEVC